MGPKQGPAGDLPSAGRPGGAGFPASGPGAHDLLIAPLLRPLQVEGDPFKTLFVASLPYTITEEQLRKEFEEFGPIRRVVLVSDVMTSKPRGYAFLEYEHQNDMKEAFKRADGRLIGGRRCVVDVERGRTVEGWKPRRLGGGLGGAKRAAKVTVAAEWIRGIQFWQHRAWTGSRLGCVRRKRDRTGSGSATPIGCASARACGWSGSGSVRRPAVGPCRPFRPLGPTAPQEGTGIGTGMRTVGTGKSMRRYATIWTRPLSLCFCDCCHGAPRAPRWPAAMLHDARADWVCPDRVAAGSGAPRGRTVGCPGIGTRPGIGTTGVLLGTTTGGGTVRTGDLPGTIIGAGTGATTGEVTTGAGMTGGGTAGTASGATGTATTVGGTTSGPGEGRGSAEGRDWRGGRRGQGVRNALSRG